MTVRWQFLTDAEKRRLEDYDAKITALILRKGQAAATLVEAVSTEIRQLHSLMDVFILELEEKYCPIHCTCRKIKK